MLAYVERLESYTYYTQADIYIIYGEFLCIYSSRYKINCPFLLDLAAGTEYQAQLSLTIPA
jgi:hypothetical protein